MAKESHTAFQFGFSLVGKRESMTGEDVVGLFTAPDDIIPAAEDSVPRGTPITIKNDGSGNPVITLATDDEVPEGLLYDHIADDLTDFELLQGLAELDEIRPGNKATYVPVKENAIIKTDLIDDDASSGFALEEDIYVKKTSDNNPKFTNDDDGGTRSNVFGKIIAIDGDDITIMLK